MEIRKETRMTLDVLAIVGGSAVMVLGSYMLVAGASNIARRFGVTEMVIGATIVALGTSLPEFLAIVVASARGEAGIGLGNIVGSNTINVVAILGLGVIIMPITITRAEVSATTIIAFIAASLYLLFCLLFRKEITRIDGLALFTAFVLYSWFSYAIKPGQ